MDKIYYFTGTGNCLMLARKMAAILGNAKLIRIGHPEFFPKDTISGRIIIIYPVYCGNAPNIVLDFVKSLKLSDQSFVYPIASHGGHAVVAGPQVAKILNDKGFYNYKLFEIEMIHNGAFITEPPSKEAIRKKLDLAYKKAEEIAKSLLSNPSQALANAEDIITEISANPMAKKVVLSFNPSKMKNDFFLNGSCMNCGICEAVCPMNALKVTSDGPLRNDACQLCLACFQACPINVIQYVHGGVKEHNTVNKKRYINPDISLEDLTNDYESFDAEQNDCHTLFYFTGTGNCMDVAKRLAHSFDENIRLIRVCKENLHLAKKTYSGKIGIVFPTYSNNMPIMLKNFLEELNVNSKADNYIYSVLVHGGMPGRCHVYIESILKRKAAALDASFNVHLPHNGVILFDSESKSKQDLWFSALDSRIAEIVDAVNAENIVRAETTMPGKKAMQKLGLKIPPAGFKLSDEQDAPNFLFDPQKTEKKFFTDEKCNACGTCLKVCPADNISLVDSKPVWNGHCESCMACINLCPKESIQCGEDTISRKRYRNPNIALKDMAIR